MWTLEEAIRRTLPFADAQRLEYLSSNMPGDALSHEPELQRFRDLRAQGLALHKEGDDQAAEVLFRRAHAIEARIERSREQWHDMNEALDIIYVSFSNRMMPSGRLDAIGQIVGGNGEPVTIPAKVWRHAAIDWGASALSYGPHADRVRMVSVRVRPLLHVPGAPALPVPRSLAEAFQTYVLDDPAIEAALDRANGCFVGDYACRCSEVSRGMFTDETALWPAAIEHHAIASEWMDASGTRFAGLGPAARRSELSRLAGQTIENGYAMRFIRAAEEEVLDRVSRFLAPLRSGEIVAKGWRLDEAKNDKGEPIVTRTLGVVEPDFWARPTTRIDFIDSALLTTTGGPPKRIWETLTLSRLSNRFQS